VRGHGHDTAGAVIGQNKISREDRHFPTGERIETVRIKEETFFFVIFRSAHQFVLLFDFFDKLHDIFFYCLAFGQFHNQRMFRGYQHEGRAEERVLAGCEYFDGAVAVGHREVHFAAIALANPVFLHRHDAFRPAGQLVTVIQKFLNVCGDFEKPLIQHLLLHFRAAAPALPAFDLFVSQHRIALGAEINGGTFFISQAFLIHPDKEKLFPPVIFRLASGNFPVPVVAEAHAFELFFHVLDIFVGPFRGMNLMLDGGVFRRHAEGIPADRMQNIETFHAFVAGNNIADGVIADMTDMNFAGGIREHLQQIIFFLLRIFGNLEGFFILPFLLPFLFDN